MPSLAPCPRCGRSSTICVCDKVVPLSARLGVLILQHPREQDVELGSAQLVTASLATARLSVGLSWRSLAQALEVKEADPARWAVIFPGKDIPEAAKTQGFWLEGKGGIAMRPSALAGVVVLDGTWSQAKSLWWRNPWLSKLPRLTLLPREPSIYGTLRREPKRQYLSTLESVAEALVAAGEPAETRAELRRLFRTMVQRARDARRSPGASSA
jgi:DTW domain-containing protein